MSYMRADIYSECLCRYVRMNIVLPTDAKRPIPVLYLLHGMTDDETCWQRRSSVERYADDTGIAVVMPDGGLSWYCDTPGGEPYFRFVSDELPRLTRRMLPQLSYDRNDTFVGGISMGGYGAMKCALRRPDIFSAVICLSGALDPVSLPDFVDPDTAAGFRWENAFGPLGSVSGSENDIFAAAEKIDRDTLRFYMWCGTDDSLIGMSRAMRTVLERRGCRLVYKETPGGHEWKLWDRELSAAMNLLRGKEN